MSDALTDINRDQRRDDMKRKFFACLYILLKDPGKDKEKKIEDIEKVAKEVDLIPGGYTGSRTNISENLIVRIHKLLDNNGSEWARTLIQARNTGFYKKLKELSPFKNALVAFVAFVGDDVILGGDIGDFFKEVLKNKGFETNRGNYVVLLPEVKRLEKKLKIYTFEL